MCHLDTKREARFPLHDDNLALTIRVKVRVRVRWSNGHDLGYGHHDG